MQTLDIVLAICFVPALIRGFSKGFIEQAASLVALFLSVFMAWKFSGALSAYLAPKVNLSMTLLSVICFLSILIVVSIGMVLLGKLLSKFVKVVMLGWLDTLLGLLFSILCTVVILGVLIVSFDCINVKYAIVPCEKLESSVLYTSIRAFSWFVFPYLKEFIVL